MDARFSRSVVTVCAVVLLLAAAAPSEGQGGPPPAKVVLTPYDGNPVLASDPTLAWEAGGVGRQRVIAHDGLLYMFYIGNTIDRTSGSIGYATSEDGLVWTRYEENPVFVPDPAISPNGVMSFAILLDGETWTIYFSPWPGNTPWYMFSSEIMIATAPSPNGPWTVNPEPVLSASDFRGWDYGGHFFYLASRQDDGYTLFYNAGMYQVGMATSADGLNWTRYDDPTTESSAFATSDPVFQINPNADAWDHGLAAQPTVRTTDWGWEMFYTAGPVDATGTFTDTSIGYAMSPDGITWTKLGDAPVLTDANKLLYPETIAEVNGNHFLYYVVISKTWTFEGIAAATITYE